jgi:6-phosphofructokinase 1
VPIVLEGKYGCLDHLEAVLKSKGHAVVVVAEGAGEELCGASAEVDAGGNRRLPEIGVLLIDTIVAHFS